MDHRLETLISLVKCPDITQRYILFDQLPSQRRQLGYLFLGFILQANNLFYDTGIKRIAKVPHQIRAIGACQAVKAMADFPVHDIGPVGNGLFAEKRCQHSPGLQVALAVLVYQRTVYCGFEAGKVLARCRAERIDIGPDVGNTERAVSQNFGGVLGGVHTDRLGCL